MFKNLLILVLSSCLSFGAGVAATQHCPFVKKVVGCRCVEKCDCNGCSSCTDKGCCNLKK
jgi:hypothetical protein